MLTFRTEEEEELRAFYFDGFWPCEGETGEDPRCSGAMAVVPGRQPSAQAGDAAC